MRIALFLCLILGSAAHAEEWGLTAGASSYGPRAGLISSIFLSDNLKLRTGLVYAHRRYDLDFVDLPAFLQWNLTHVVGVYAGPQISLHTKGDLMYQYGFNFLFDHMWGFDAFYEQSAERFDDGAQLKSFGAALVYYFL